MFHAAKVRRFLHPHNTLSMLFAYHVYGILQKKANIFELFRAMGHAFRLSDGTGRTHQTAEMAANAAGADKARTATVVIEDDGLVTTVVARHLTTATADWSFSNFIGTMCF